MSHFASDWCKEGILKTTKKEDAGLPPCWTTMRRHLITLVLTTGTLVSTDATRLSKDSALLTRRHPGPASELDVLDKRTWTSSSLNINFVKRKNGGDNGDDDDKDGDDKDDDDKYGDGKDDDDWRKKPFPPPGDPDHTHTSTTTSTGTLTSALVINTNPPSSSPSIVSTSTTPVSTSPLPLPTGTKTGIDDGGDGGQSNSINPTNQGDNGGKGADDGGNKDGDSKTATSATTNAAAISGGVLGGFLLLLISWYWFVIRPKRRERLTGQHMVLPKDSDLESHVTVDLRNGPGSSSDGLSSHIMSTGTLGHIPNQGQHVVVESAARSLSIPSSPHIAQTEPYAGVNRGSPNLNHTPFMEAYAAPHPAYSQERARSYSSRENLRGVIPPIVPSQGHPSPLQIDAFPTHPNPTPSTMELDGRPPPPRYPDAIAASQVPGSSPTSPLPVSPLSVISLHQDPHALTTDGVQYHQQQYQGPRQPNYGDYEPSSLPEVVSPICQLGQTSASLPEYDESAEAARSGVGNRNHLVSQHHLHGGDEKQALPQQPMPRY